MKNKVQDKKQNQKDLKIDEKMWKIFIYQWSYLCIHYQSSGYGKHYYIQIAVKLSI